MLLKSLCLAGLMSIAVVAKGETTHVTSKDGTRIAYEKFGKGPALIIVNGALSDRTSSKELAQLLATHLTVYSYDRRGRGDSTDTKAYSVQHEIEDIEALIDHAGGSAFVYGKSSGAALALHAAAQLGDKVKKLAIYEPPYSEAEGAAREWQEFRAKFDQLLAAERRADAVASFLQFVGMPAEAIAKTKASPAWQGMVAMAPTLAYDNVILGSDRSVPVSIASKVKAPTLVMDGGASSGPMPFMRATADKLGKTVPSARRHTIEGQGHDVSSKALVPVLLEFLR
jgi:pimeloyl-ACP methyl ester carboxylesterase